MDDKIPFKEQHVIDELIEFWQTLHEPHGLATHINGLFGGMVQSFFRQVYKDLRTDRSDKYDTYSASEFKRFLESEYSQLVQAQAEHQAAEVERKVKEYEEHKKKAKADFDALGKEMTKATSREELVELGRRRAALAPYIDYIDVPRAYENHCWNCNERISSAIHARCPGCGFYICSSCGSCFC